MYYNYPERGRGVKNRPEREREDKIKTEITHQEDKEEVKNRPERERIK